ncbi:hypothetical protein EPO34_00740 [Patescibacteria group bacterium]|nr:MAG: hypothetical protein EPO34_00740 [Patescibacteria group bacterium]
MNIVKLFNRLVESYLFVVVIALVAGLAFSERISILTAYTTVFLQIIFFLSSLKLDPKAIVKEAKDVKLILLVNAFKLLILPAVVYLVAARLYPSMAVPLLLLSAVPSGMTTPLLVEVVGGKQGLALVLTVTSSLIAPLTIPLVIGHFAGTAVTVNAFEMFQKLVQVIVIPFLIAQAVRAFLDRRLSATYFTFKPISIVILGLLIAGAVAKQASVILSHVDMTMLILLCVLFLFVALMLSIGYAMAYWRDCSDRLTVAVSTAFMNFSLAIFLADAFFPDPNVLLASVLVIFPWAMMLLPFKHVVHRFICKTPA